MKRLAIVLVGLLVVLAWPAYAVYTGLQKLESEDPAVWEEDIAQLEAAANETPPAANSVVFIGSSSIRLWETLAQDMAPIPVVRQGFGGAKLNDVVYYAERLVNVHKPSAVVIFAGSNDIRPSDSKAPEVLLESYKQFIKTVRANNADLPIYFIAITPSILRWEVWSNSEVTNQLITEYSALDANLYVIDTAAELLGEDGEPDPAKYKFDRLHLSEQGYAVWTRIIKPYLLPYSP